MTPRYNWPYPSPFVTEKVKRRVLRYKPATGSRLVELCTPKAPCVDNLAAGLQSIGQTIGGMASQLTGATAQLPHLATQASLYSWNDGVAGAGPIHNKPAAVKIGDVYTNDIGKTWVWSGIEWLSQTPFYDPLQYDDLPRSMNHTTYDPWRLSNG